MVGFVIRRILIMNKQIKNFILIFLYFFPIYYILEIILYYIFKLFYFQLLNFQFILFILL